MLLGCFTLSAAAIESICATARVANYESRPRKWAGVSLCLLRSGVAAALTYYHLFGGLDTSQLCSMCKCDKGFSHGDTLHRDWHRVGAKRAGHYDHTIHLP